MSTPSKMQDRRKRTLEDLTELDDDNKDKTRIRATFVALTVVLFIRGPHKESENGMFQIDRDLYNATAEG